MVFQNYALYPHMSVYDNMAFGLKMRKVRPRRHRQAGAGCGRDPWHPGVAQAQARGSSSGGPSASGWHSDGRLSGTRRCFLFDEPLSNLDAKLRVQMRVELKKAARPARHPPQFT